MDKGMPEVIQRHPYAPFLPPGARALFLGSAPPARFCLPEPKPLGSRDLDYYYGSGSHGGNLFWDTLISVLEPESLPGLETLRALEPGFHDRSRRQRVWLQAFLSRHRLGIADILQSFGRKSGSARDSALSPREFADILSLAGQIQSPPVILCTSHQVRNWLNIYLRAKGYALQERRAGEFLWIAPRDGGSADRAIEFPRVGRLPSPSPMCCRRFASRDEFRGFLRQAYAEVLRRAGIL